MPACWATRRASPRSSAPQQRPWASTPDWSQRSMERPTTGTPCLASSQAVTEESRPPLMATAVISGVPLIATASPEMAAKPGAAPPPRAPGRPGRRRRPPIVLVIPKLIRRDESASSRGSPMASSVLLGSTVPDEQAEPVETAKPARSRRISSALALDAREGHVRGVGQPRRGLAVEEDVRHPVGQSGLEAVAQAAEMSSAAPPAPRRPRPPPRRSPTRAGTFSVPARRRRSWPPPTR